MNDSKIHHCDVVEPNIYFRIKFLNKQRQNKKSHHRMLQVQLATRLSTLGG